jgi:hypothetical protein
VKRLVGKLKLIYLLSEARNFRNDGWVQKEFREKYKEALIAYIKDYY